MGKRAEAMPPKRSRAGKRAAEAEQPAEEPAVTPAAGSDAPAAAATPPPSKRAKAKAAMKETPATEPISPLNAQIMLDLQNNLQAIHQHPIFDGIMTAPALDFGTSLTCEQSAVQDRTCLNSDG